MSATASSGVTLATTSLSATSLLPAVGALVTMASRNPGWYPDPNDDNAEVYWDGSRWHGRRNKIAQSSPPAPGPTFSASSGSDVGARLRETWHGFDEPRRRLIIIGSAVAVLLIAIILVATEPWHSREYKDCVSDTQRTYATPKSEAERMCGEIYR